MTSCISLEKVSEGASCTVQKVAGDRSKVARLRELGFICNAKLFVVSSDKRGVIVRMNDTRLAISQDIASKITVAY